MIARLLILSDVHYAGPLEQQRTRYEARSVDNPLARILLSAYRRYVWLRDPLSHNHLLPALCDQAGEVDKVVANGDFSCDTAFVGVIDAAARQSAEMSLGYLRQRYQEKFHAVMGDHELGKKSLGGGKGGLRIESLRTATDILGIAQAWSFNIGLWRLVGVASSVLALPVLQPETLESEWAEWQAARQKHFTEIRAIFDSIKPGERVLLFCHDPTALPFLIEEPSVAAKMHQLERTIIGHLHTPAVFGLAKRLAGMPRIDFLGTTPKRLSSALRKAKDWEPFRVVLCPSPPGIQLLKDGGFLTVRLNSESPAPLDFQRHRLSWRKTEHDTDAR